VARVTLNLTATFTPAFYALLETAQLIAERHGEERAQEWASAAMLEDMDLFCVISASDRPNLRLIQGGLYG
jgi:hypothetical protein